MKLAAGWKDIFEKEMKKEYMINLQKFLKEEYSNGNIYPKREYIFRIFEDLSFEDVKVLILGQDPYHGSGQANGYAFAVNEGFSTPPSLQNIFKEIKSNYGEVPNSTALDGWVQQGILLLNTVLTVKDSTPNSHKNQGWEIFTDQIIKSLGCREKPMVFMLWGNSARTKKSLIQNTNHLILEAPHPSPLSAHKGFIGCSHFVKANEFLEQKINWTISRSLKNAY